MNAAILFDSAEEDTSLNHPRLLGQELYTYALKACYINSSIDRIFLLCKHTGAQPDVLRDIFIWQEEYDMHKQVTVLRGIRSVAQLWLHMLQSKQDVPDVYVFHDIRFPMVTGEMIVHAAEAAREHGIFAFCGAQMGKGADIWAENVSDLKYPVAVKADSHVLHCLEEPRQILKELFYQEPYLCENPKENIPVYNRREIERAERILQARRLRAG